MSRWILARHAARNFIAASSSRISKFALSNLHTLPSSPSPRSFVSPQIPTLFNNPRFFSHLNGAVSLTNESSENGAVPPHNESSDNGAVSLDDGEHVAVEGEEVEETYEIDLGKLEAALSLLKGCTDGSLESSLNSMNLDLHKDFVARMIESESVSGENLIRFFNWACKEKSFAVTTPAVESLVSAVCGGDGLKKKEVYSLWDLVKEIGEKEKGVLNVGILSELIVSMSKLGKGKAALEVFDKLEAFEIVPDSDSYYFTIEALCRRSAFDWAWSVCQKMLDSQSLPDGEKVGNMVSWLCKGEKVREAHALYVAAMEKKKLPPVSCISFLVVKLSRENETVKLALEVLNDIPGDARNRAIKPFSAVVQALCRVKDLDEAKQLVLKMIADGPPPGNAVFNYVINGYCKAGEMGQAVEMMKLLESRGLRPDLYAYTVLMSGYSNGGEMEEAMKVLADAKRKHSKLTPVMYHTLIRGYCKLEQFDKASELLAEMTDFGVCPNADEYEKLIQSLCLKALDWETAEKLQEQMKENGLHLKGITRALVRAVKEMGKEVVEAESIRSAA